jgi:hypothetical protein
MFVLEHKLREREHLIKSMKGELEKNFLDDRGNMREIYIADPERNNLELYNELNHSKELFHKMSKLLSAEKLKNQFLEGQLKVNYFNNQDSEEKIYKLRQGILVHNKDNASDFDMTSDDDSVIDNQSELNGNLDSPVVKFPEKVKMPNMNKSTIIPKLDFSKVHAKYTATPNNIQIANGGHVKTNRSSNEYIEKLKFQLKVCKNTIKLFKKKFEKYKQVFHSQKSEILRLRSKFELQERKSGGPPTYEQETSHKTNVHNTTMVFI